MNGYRDQVAAALRAVTIRGATRYAWLGRAGPSLDRELEAELDETAARDFLATSLSDELYWSFYCHGRPVPRWRAFAEPAVPDPQLTTALSQANTGRGSWEHGWTVERLDGGDAVAASRVRARVPIERCLAGDRMRPGATIAVRVPRELPSLSPGFYTAVGDAARDGTSAHIVRAYWHVTRAGAPALMHAVTTRLNAAEVPFRLKVADHPFRLDRCDAAVLYVPADRLAAIRATLLDVAVGLATHLRPEVPAFTVPLAPGVALAEDGAGVESFGTRRCRLLAEAIVRAHVEKVTGIDARIDVVEEQFAGEGIALDAPYRDPSLDGRHVL